MPQGPDANAPRFGPDYRESATLDDGTRVVVRPVRRSDVGLLRKGFEELSAESRYRRFFGAKKALSQAELSYLTECDGINHFAIGAVLAGPDGREQGVGVARFVRLTGENAADGAVTVIDAMHHKGLGGLLVDRLLAAAAERGIEELRFSVLASNHPMSAVLRKLETRSAPHIDEQIGGGVLEYRVKVSPRAASRG